MTWKVLVADADYAPSMNEVKAAFPNLDLRFVDAQHDAASLASNEVTAIVTQGATVDAALLDKLGGLKLVFKNGRNYNNVDVDAVRSRNLGFACVARKGPNCVAELAMTMILALSKDLIISNESVAARSLPAARAASGKDRRTQNRLPLDEEPVGARGGGQEARHLGHGGDRL